MSNASDAVSGPDFTCAYCGAIYGTTIQHVASRTHGQAKCEVCNAIMDEWEGTNVPSYVLKKAPEDRSVAPELRLRVEVWNAEQTEPVELMAICSDMMVARAAFWETVRRRPGQPILLRQGDRIITRYVKQAVDQCG